MALENLLYYGLSHSELCLIKVTLLSVDYKGDIIRIKSSLRESKWVSSGNFGNTKKGTCAIKKKLIIFAVASKEGLFECNLKI